MPTDPEPDDLALIGAVRVGDRDALGTLLSRYQSKVYGLCYRIVGHRERAADLAQDSLVKVIQNLDRFDGRAQFGTWVYRIATNVCISHLRAQKLRKHASLEAPARSTRDTDETRMGANLEQRREPAVAPRVQAAEDRSRLFDALATLDGEQRAILVLRDSRGLDYDQIAEVLGVPTGTVKSRLFRARAALRAAVEKDRDPDDD
jgi:RNA polymerase sigma-70 factor (ECF subfamily)